MNEFKGFPDRMQFTPVPNLVFSSLAGQINDITELKTLLHVFEFLYPQKGACRYVTADQLMAHPSLVNDLKDITRESLEKTLETLTARGILLKMPATHEQVERIVYFLNNSGNRALIEKARRSEVTIDGFQAAPPPLPAPVETADIYTLYEQNIGIITPLIAEELKEAQKNYPESWIEEAVKEAVSQNKRNWKYISRILERWSTEGKKDGTYRGNPKTNPDPDKYIRGKYGHMVQR